MKYSTALALQSLVALPLAKAKLSRKSSGLGLDNFSTLVVFGDSYTDDFVHQYRPGPDGTIGTPSSQTSTGGRVWPEYISQYANTTVYDYAVSGAVCNTAVANSPRNGVARDQIPEFLLDNSFISNTTGKPALSNPPDSTVYAIWIGTNDIGNGAYLTDDEPRGLTITNYTDCVFQQLDRLYEVGARKFVLMNLAPLELAPQYALPENGGVKSDRYWNEKSMYNPNITQTSEKMRHYVQLVNAVYEYKTPFEFVVQERYSGSVGAVFDVYGLMSDIWHQPSSYLNGTAPLNVTGSVAQCRASNCSSSASLDSFMWFDELHPSEQTDRIIAREFINVVQGQSQWGTYWSDS